tara:strand:+ start:241 stop:2100 length:1860 start_codon:yes stop_codon:yes gene_type:complete
MNEEERDLEAELKEEKERFEAQNQEAFDKEVSGENEIKAAYEKNREKLKKTREESTDPDRFQSQLETIKKITPDLSDPKEASEFFTDMIIDTGIIGRSLGEDLPTGIATVIQRRLTKNPSLQKIIKESTGLSVDPAQQLPDDAIPNTGLGIIKQMQEVFSGRLFGITGGTFPVPKGAAFDENVLKKYVDDALAYRTARLEEKTVQGFSPKRVDLMKGFGRTVRNKSGQEFILVRKRKVPNPDVREATENYQLRSLWSVEDQLVKKRGFEFKRTPEVAELNKLKVELNKFKNQHGDRYYAALMEQGERAYLEHKVARGQSWFWNRIENPKAGETFGNWVKATNRNNIENLRLLFREPFKQIKDTTEMRLAARQANIKDDFQKLVIDIEDPLSGDIFKRSNPGNLLIRRADDGQVVGLIGDFYQELYSEAFKNNYSIKKLRAAGIPERYKARPEETLKQYQARIFNEKLDQAFQQRLTHQQLREQSLDEMAEFFDTFDEQLGMIDTPQWVKNIQRGRFDDPVGREAVKRNVEDLRAIQATKEIDNSLLKMLEDEEAIEKTINQFARFTDMEDPNLFEAAQKILEDFRAKTPVGEQGLIAEIGEEQARSRLMKILFDKHGAK